jgi:hypothetical protein
MIQGSSHLLIAPIDIHSKFYPSVVGCRKARHCSVKRDEFIVVYSLLPSPEMSEGRKNKSDQTLKLQITRSGFITSSV